MISSWPCPLPGGGTADELAVQITAENVAESGLRILMLPPLFDEHNKMRRFMAQVMRALADDGVPSVLPDLTGLNESAQALENQKLSHWRGCVSHAIEHFEVSHVLAVRSGAMLVPDDARGWLYAPQSGVKMLRAMIRARTISSKEAGIAETSDEISELGHSEGVTLNGWPISAALFTELESAETPQSDRLAIIDQSLVGGSGIWLRAEPDEDSAQSASLATAILEDLGTPE